MSRLVRVGVLAAVVLALSGCYNVKHAVVVNDDLTIDQHLIVTVDTEQMGGPSSLSREVSSSVSGDPAATDFETWWAGTFEDEFEFEFEFDGDPFTDELGVPAIPDDPIGVPDDTSFNVGHSDAEIQRMQSYFGDRMTYRTVDEPPLMGFDLTITAMTVAEANEYPLSPNFAGTAWALDESDDQITLTVTLPGGGGAGGGDQIGLEWEQTFQMPGAVTANSHGDVSGSNVVSVSYADATAASAMVFTSGREASDAWWSFAQPVIDAVEDTIGWMMVAIIFGALVLVMILIKVLRKRGGSGGFTSGADEVPYAPAAPALGTGYSAGTTFMPHGAQPQQGFAPQGQPQPGQAPQAQPMQGYPFQNPQPQQPQTQQPQPGFTPQQQPQQPGYPQQGYPPQGQ